MMFRGEQFVGIEKLAALKIDLPTMTKPVAAFVPFARVGGLVFVSGHIAKKNGEPWEGQLGAALTIEQGKEAARGVAIELIATLNTAVGDLNRIRRIVKMQVLVNSIRLLRTNIWSPMAPRNSSWRFSALAEPTLALRLASLRSHSALVWRLT